MRERAAIYARYSSHNQREESIEIQLEADRAYAVENDLDVVAEYCDYAQTGRTTDRAQFQRMMLDARRGLFRYVIIYKVTRIMRNRDEMAITRVMLKRAGVDILYAGEDIPDGSSGTLMLGFLEVLAEWESDLDSERIRDGVAKNARDCKASGNVLFGYDVGPDGRYVVNEREAAGVRLAYDRFCAGERVADIVRALRPWPTKRGAGWRQQSVTKLLKRPQYYGLYRYAGVEVEDGMPAIISREQWDDAQRRFAATSHVRPHDGAFALTGKLYHGPCEEPMVGVCGTSHTGRVYNYYRCRRCHETVPRDATEDAVAKTVVDVLGDPETRARIADMVMECRAEDAGVERQSDVIRGELGDIETTYSRIWRAIEDGVAPPGGAERIKALGERQELLEQELATAVAMEGRDVTRDDVMAWLDRVGSMDAGDVIETFVSRVWLVDGELRLVFNFDGREAQDDPSEVLPGSPELHQVFYGVRAHLRSDPFLRARRGYDPRGIRQVRAVSAAMPRCEVAGRARLLWRDLDASSRPLRPPLLGGASHLGGVGVWRHLLLGLPAQVRLLPEPRDLTRRLRHRGQLVSPCAHDARARVARRPQHQPRDAAPLRSACPGGRVPRAREGAFCAHRLQHLRIRARRRRTRHGRRGGRMAHRLQVRESDART